jgi:hypothetical protein
MGISMYNRIVALGTVAFAGILVSAASLGQQAPMTAQTGAPNEQTGSQAGPVINSAQLTKEQFRALPPNAVLDIQITKAELLAQAKARSEQEIQSQAKSLQAKVAADFNAARTKFLEQQNAELQARNAKVMAEIIRLKNLESQFEASLAYKVIETETTDLQAQFDNASPADRAKIQARARVLHEQLRQMQASAVR